MLCLYNFSPKTVGEVAHRIGSSQKRGVRHQLRNGEVRFQNHSVGISEATTIQHTISPKEPLWQKRCYGLTTNRLLDKPKCFRVSIDSMVGLSRVKDHQKLWFQSKNKRLKPMVHNGHTLKSCSHRRQTMTTTSKSLTHEIDLDGSSRNGKYETRWRQKDVDWYGLYRNDLPCLYASMSPVSDIYVVLQENLLVWHKISKCTTPQEQNCNHSPQKALWEINKKERTNLKQSL